jgi:predicted RNA-binding protein YlxR (DUF448 family)
MSSEGPTNVDTTMHRRPDERRAPTRTCVGCGVRDDASALVRLVVEDREVAFDLAGGAFGRGAHLHPRPTCMAKAPRGIDRAFRGQARVDGAELGRRLVSACDRRMRGLLLAAHRLRAVAIGADASFEALRVGDVRKGGLAALAVVAVDAGSVASSNALAEAVAGGRGIAWATKSELGGMLGEKAVAICVVRHARIAAELKRMRAAADAGVAMAGEGAECSSRFPEAR